MKILFSGLAIEDMVDLWSHQKTMLSFKNNKFLVLWSFFKCDGAWNLKV